MNVDNETYFISWSVVYNFHHAITPRVIFVPIFFSFRMGGNDVYFDHKSLKIFKKSFLKERNSHLVNVLYRSLNAFNKARLINKKRSKTPKIIMPILREVDGWEAPERVVEVVTVGVSIDGIGKLRWEFAVKIGESAGLVVVVLVNAVTAGKVIAWVVVTIGHSHISGPGVFGGKLIPRYTNPIREAVEQIPIDDDNNTSNCFVIEAFWGTHCHENNFYWLLMPTNFYILEWTLSLIDQS